MRRAGRRTRVAAWLAAAATGLLAVLPAAARAQSGADADRGIRIIEEAAARYRSVDALCADFTQHLVVPLLGDERTGSGRVCQARPNRFEMRFLEPAGDRIVVDGTHVWLYYPSMDAKQVVRAPVAERPGGHDFHREFLEDPETKYEVTYEGEDEVDGQPTYRLRLRPKTAASYEEAVLWIDRGQPALRRLRLEEENGTIRTITLSNIEFGARPGGAWFTFTPPAGAHVITG